MNRLITHCQLFAPISFFNQCVSSSEIIFEKHEHYQKKSTRNRYTILTTNGIQHLSVPLASGKNTQQLITDVKIAYDENWIKNHLYTIRSSYGKSPYFEYYFPDIEAILSKKYTFLFDLDIDTFNYILDKLELNPIIGFTEYFDKNYKKSSAVVTKDIKYPQVWEEKFNFTPNLSVLDLLFCTGPEATGILKMMNLSNITLP